MKIKKQDCIGYYSPLGILSLLALLLWIPAIPAMAADQPVLVDHHSTDITKIPESAIVMAKQNLHIAYGHTSHGSQLTDAMTAMVAFMNGKGYPTDLYAWNQGGSDGALDLHDYAMGGDVGYYPAWVNNTHSYLGTVDPDTGRGSSHPDVNVIIWSWCGQVSWLTEQQIINEYLTPMNALESEYWGVKFVYMTSHLDGSGVAGNLNQRNNQIRQYCQLNNKILYDFADIESYDPTGNTNYMALYANDACYYDTNGDGHPEIGDDNSNWAIVWQNSHLLNADWFNCSAAHTQPLNGNRKAYAAWWLWARLAGWNGSTISCDFNGDGQSDIGVWRPNSGYWFIKDQSAYQWGTDGDMPVPGNYDGDGQTDIAVWRPSNGYWYIMGQGAYQWGMDGDIPVPGDYNGDGRTDIAVWRPSNGYWYIMGQGAYQWGTDGDIPVPGDYNGDGQTDIAVWRPSNGSWYVMGQGVTQWGMDGDEPVPGDYNSDGQSDITVWRPANGSWYVMGQGIYQWGTNGDIPVCGDYDGNGHVDMAVWRPSNGYWFIIGQGIHQWGTNGDVPLD